MLDLLRTQVTHGRDLSWVKTRERVCNIDVRVYFTIFLEISLVISANTFFSLAVLGYRFTLAWQVLYHLSHSASSFALILKVHTP
jgi:hypothetical protein